MVYSNRGDREHRHLLLFFIILTVWETGSGQVHYSVLEEAKHGTFVGRIAQDLGLELTELVPRMFRVASKGHGDLLEVNLQNGILFVNSRIDREELCGRSAECSIHLEVIVDRPLQVFHVEVEVKDINDNAPVFPQTQKNLFMAESRMLDSRFPLEDASDADIEENALLTYRLSPNEFFSLDVPTNDEQVKPLGLVLRKPLDREQSPELHLLLTATDRGKPELTGSVQLLIKVLDANDNAPAFDKTLYAVKLPENIPNGTLVIKLNASDLDEGSNADIIYSFSSDVSPDIKSKFYIDAINGEIVAIGHIDFEESKTYKLRIEAIDKGSLPLAGHCTVHVQVLDANDNAPELALTSLSLPISENAQPGTVITLINVSDRDSGANGEVICSLTPHVPFKLMSTFKNYYSLVLDSALDRKTLHSYNILQKYTMLVYTPSNPKALRLLLLLLLPAAWKAGSGQLHYSVPEEAKHGTFVGRIAQDLGLELMELVPRLFRVASTGHGDLLEVNLQNGILFVNSRIDREELCGRSAECSIHLEVIVDRPLQVFHVEVEVKDINDNPPVFSVSQQKLSIPESRLLDSRFPLEGASDADVGENAVLTYRLSPNEFFILDTINKKDKGKFPVLVLRKMLDREENPQLQLLLTATDGGKPEYTGSVTLLILVLDANDNEPVFDRSVYEVKMYENSANQTLVIWLNASDADEGINKEMIYSFSALVPPSIRSKFLMNEKTGEIRVNDAIDFEDSNTYEIHVDVTDKGNPPMVGHCTVLVEVLDENDNSPMVIITSLSLPVREDAQVGTVIALISVSDRDSGANGQVTCSLTPRVPFKLVSTFKNYYSLVLNSQIDREELCGRSAECSIHLEVIVDRPLQVFHVEVEVKDINDNPPVFPATQKNLFISETRALDSHFSLEGASDADIGANALLTYKLSPNEYFSLEVPTNDQVKPLQLVLKKPLDREVASELLLVLQATDGGKPELTGSTELHITVLDVNDNAPVFDKAVHRVKLPENSRNGTLVIRLNASDLDEGSNSHILYSFAADVSSNTEDFFHIDSASGEIKVNGKIDFEETKLWKLQVEAVDKGHPPMFGHCTILVEILDINDNAPELLVTSLLLSVPEDATLGTVIALISVTDRDAGENGQVTCSLTPRVPFTLVSTFKNYYSLVLDSALDRESVSNYELVGAPKTDLMAFSPSLPPGLSSTEETGEREPDIEHLKEGFWGVREPGTSPGREVPLSHRGERSPAQLSPSYARSLGGGCSGYAEASLRALSFRSWEDGLASPSVFRAPPGAGRQDFGEIPASSEWRRRLPSPSRLLVSAPLGGAALLCTRQLRFPRWLPHLQSGERSFQPASPGQLQCVQAAERRRSGHL
ncbi:protocadherin alpha-10-like [Enhydra lutris kenyoni]|uniref:Protocadherin alpha-10-like n=2 Tax=Mustelidae TaxID=9655 RepID=A0A2Y9ISZ2_ENHLU|nr:protocadherin alpha-10-like [Enhydra lutris kenyoni]